MKRLIVPALCLVIASAAACSKKSSDTTAAAPESQPAAAAPAGGPAAAPEAAPAEPRKIEITDDLVQKFMEYQKENYALVQQYVAETRKNLEAAKGDTLKTLNQISINEKLSKEMDEKLKAKRQALGLGEEEFEAVKDATQTLAVGRSLYNQMGGDAQLAKMEAEQKQQIAKLPAEQRAAAETQMADMTRSLREVRDGLELRKKFGDKSADVVLKYGDALAKQYTEMLQLAAGKK